MILKNVELDAMLKALKPLLDRSDILGYLAARNTKILTDLTAEYHDFKNELILKYGKHDIDEDGNELQTISIYPGYEDWEEYVKEMEAVMNVEQEFIPVTTSYEKAMGVLTGTQLLELDWMFHE